MRLREPEMPLDPEIERELSAIEAGLEGLSVEVGLADVADVAPETRSLRSAPGPAFANRLDERVGEGFPREGHFETARSSLVAIPPRRVLMPLAAAATLLIAVGVGISQLGGSSGGGGVTT